MNVRISELNVGKKNETAVYNRSYFSGDEFLENDYSSMASAIVELFRPNSVVEFGCGQGYLASELIRRGVQVVAMDGYATPSIVNENFTFHRIDLNSDIDLHKLIESMPKFSLAVSFEVAEHLDESSSRSFVKAICSRVDAVAFSAAVPEQTGTGHINCKPRRHWKKLFEEEGFYLDDSLRKMFRSYDKIAIWYKLNTLVFRRCTGNRKIEDLERVIDELLDSESFSSSTYFKLLFDHQRVQYLVGVFGVRHLLRLRGFIKSVLGRA